jgi:YesN/AraC family two-component response regulator
MPIRILIVDDHHIVRKGLLLFLQIQQGFDVVGEAENGLIAVEKTRELKPDINLMDLSMPVMDGVEATKKICEENPAVKVMILTSFSDKNHVQPA